nr:transposase [Pseudovibrio sp. M1P-2-3]
MSRKRGKYTDEYKAAAVERLYETEVTLGKVANELGIPPRNLIEFKSRDIVASYLRTYFIKKSRFSDVQIIAILKQGESGIPVEQPLLSGPL